MVSRRALVWPFLALLVMMPGAVLASRSLASGAPHGQPSGLQHSDRTGTAWRNFSTALVVEAPRLVLLGDHQAPVADVSAPPLVLRAPVFVPPRS